MSLNGTDRCTRNSLIKLNGANSLHTKHSIIHSYFCLHLLYKLTTKNKQNKIYILITKSNILLFNPGIIKIILINHTFSKISTVLFNTEMNIYRLILYEGLFYPNVTLKNKMWFIPEISNI